MPARGPKPADTTGMDPTNAATWPEIMTTAHVAVALGVSDDTARRMFQRGEIPGYAMGPRWLIAKDVLLETIRGQR
jgi:excisionase family DNA binding protein